VRAFTLPIAHEAAMRLAAPSFLLFLVAAALAVLAVISRFRGIPFVSPNAFWFALGAWALLSFGCLFRRV
jgi:hypothetical protein